MLQVLVPIAIAFHGVGHSAGLWLQVPRWFGLAWIVPGAGFLLGSWLLWTRDGRAVPVLLASAAISVALELLSGDGLKPGPMASAFIFNAAVLVVLALPATRQFITSL